MKIYNKLIRTRWGVGRGFTLIELLIVVGIVTMTTYATFFLVSGIDNMRLHLRARLDGDEESARAAAQWRTDVAQATRVELEDGGKAMRVLRPGTDGREDAVQWRLAPGGTIERQTAPLEAPAANNPVVAIANDRVLAVAHSCASLSFSPIGRGWRMDWTLTAGDGLRSWRWPASAFATPLAAGEEGR